MRVALIGFGATGRAIGALVPRRHGRVVAAVDHAPDLIGEPVSEANTDPQVHVSATLDLTLDIDVAVVTTTSRLAELEMTVEPLLAAGIDTVSICEELGYPWQAAPDVAARLDSLARAGGATLLGTGANPGFVMDVMPIVCAGVVDSVSRIEIRRTIDLADYAGLVWRFGLGRPASDFDDDDPEIPGHIGFRQSISQLAAAIGAELDAIEAFPPEPVVVTERPRVGPHAVLAAGTVSAIRQRAQGLIGGDVLIDLNEYFAFRPEPGEVPGGDSWRLSTPGGELRIECPGGIPSLNATAAITANVLEAATQARPGLVTMGELPVASFAAPLARR